MKLKFVYVLHSGLLLFYYIMIQPNFYTLKNYLQLDKTHLIIILNVDKSLDMYMIIK